MQNIDRITVYMESNNMTVCASLSELAAYPVPMIN